MAVAMSAKPRGGLAALEQSAREAADRTRALIEHHTIESDPGQPSELAVALSDRCEELRTRLTQPSGRDPLQAAGLCELLTELTVLQQDLRDHVIGQRFRALSRIHGGLARLRQADTVTKLLGEAPEELCHCCDFDRALISRVRGSSWVPEVLCIGAGQDPEVTVATETYLKNVEIPLTPNLLETELARRGAPALITDPANDPRTYKELMGVSQTRAYVAAPIMPTGRVIGFLHADCFGSGREMSVVDRDNLWTFAEGFGLIFERKVLLERLESQRERVREAFRSAEQFIDDLCDAEVKLARQEHDADAVASTAASMFLPVESRVQALLTMREREVLSLMVNGARNIQIADQLVISEGTVKSHVKNICRKLRASNRAEAVSKYLQMLMKERS
jgi:DNA-binding CsgD family transcriptional regulator